MLHEALSVGREWILQGESWGEGRIFEGRYERREDADGGVCWADETRNGYASLNSV